MSPTTEGTTEGTGADVPAELLKLVQRPKTDAKGKEITQDQRGEAVPVLRAVTADEVFAWKDYGDRVVVVTTDGQKYAAWKDQQAAARRAAKK